MNTDTPRTDERKASFALDTIRQLETELAAVTEQRDGLRSGMDYASEQLHKVTEQLDQFENKLRIELRGHPDSKLWGDAGLIAATMRSVDAIDEVTEQRDEWKAKYLQQNKDLGYELRDPNGTIWSECKRLQTELTAARAEIERLDTAGIHSCHENCQRPNCVLRRELKAVTEQRDRLAEALRKLRNNESLSIGGAAYGIVEQALQSLTTNEL